MIFFLFLFRKRGPRAASATWTSMDGKLWLFGGTGKADLWYFNEVTKKFRYIAGQTTANFAGNFTNAGEPESTFAWPRGRYAHYFWQTGTLFWMFGGIN